MGTALLNHVYTAAMLRHLDGLSAPAFRVLCAMAHAARDTETKTAPARIYFGGWAWLAGAALNRPEPHNDRASKQAVGRAIHELQDAGLIKTRGRRGGPQSNVQYELHI